MNKITYFKTHEYGIYLTDLKFKDTFLQKIIRDIYEIENAPNNKYSHPTGVTFRIINGFHSANIIDPKYGLLEKYETLRILTSRIQELLYNFESTNINFKKGTGLLKINELWINILRVGDYNLPHNHPNHHIAGNFYLQVPKEKKDNYEGTLGFEPHTDNNLLLPASIQTGPVMSMIFPKPNLGVIFNAYLKHIVIPHFSNEDRIGIAFNAVYEEKQNYFDIYPKPYWYPSRLTYTITKEDEIDTQNRLVLNLPYDNKLYIPLSQRAERNYFNNKSIVLGEDQLKIFENKYLLSDIDNYFNKE